MSLKPQSTPTAKIIKEAFRRQEEAMRQFAIANGFRIENPPTVRTASEADNGLKVQNNQKYHGQNKPHSGDEKQTAK